MGQVIEAAVGAQCVLVGEAEAAGRRAEGQGEAAPHELVQRGQNGRRCAVGSPFREERACGSGAACCRRAEGVGAAHALAAAAKAGLGSKTGLSTKTGLGSKA